MSTSILSRLGRRQVRYYRQKSLHANSLKIRLTHNVFPKVTEVEKIILDSVKVCPSYLLDIEFFSDEEKATGPLPFSTYMQLCLSHPTHGYYMKSSNKIFGSGGDFITSPEISQVFGEVRLFRSEADSDMVLWCINSLSVSGFFHNGLKRQDTILSDLLNWDLVEGL